MVRYVSTRLASPPVDFRGALLGGLAPDGGLYQPTETATLPDGWGAWDYVESVTWALSSFGAEEPGVLVAQAASEFHHEAIAPLVAVGDRLIYELFWGPTLSFKDHALQVLGRLLGRAVEGERTVLVATSGDTGSAAMAGCKEQPNLNTFVLFPEGMVTEFQRRQMTTVPNLNVHAIAVRGNFDDCQRMVKDAFNAREGLLAVNSINFARIAAQAGFYIYLGAQMGETFDVVVPTGNFGNAYSCWLAKQMGVPIDKITLANNENHAIADIVNRHPDGQSEVRATLAPAMDIAIASNFERFKHDPAEEFEAGWADDPTILQTIAEVHSRHGYLLDPHTAAAWSVSNSTIGDRPQVVVSTAHPAKFAEAVTSAVGEAPPLPDGYPSPMELPERVETIDAETSALLDRLR